MMSSEVIDIAFAKRIQSVISDLILAEKTVLDWKEINDVLDTLDKIVRRQ